MVVFYLKLIVVAYLGMMHYNVGGRDLDNEFFTDLATPRRWVFSTVMEGKNIEFEEINYFLVLMICG